MSLYEYTLKVPFEYAYKNGNMQEANFISITAPTIKQIDKFAPIKQAFMAAASEIAANHNTENSDQSGDDVEMSTDQYMLVMYRGSGDMAQVMIYAQELFKSGVALVDGETKLTQPILDKMSIEDIEGLLGAYIANFIAPSLMDGD